MSNQYPLARKDKLVVRELEGETLVYDLTRDKALCLNRTAAAVWSASDGNSDAGQIAHKLSDEFGASIEEDVVWSAIDQLGRDHLLEYCVTKQSSGPRMTRRQQLKSLGRAAAIAGPIVAALAIPASAVTCASRLASGAPCTKAVDCCSGVCSGNPKKCG